MSKTKYTKELLAPIVSTSYSIRGVLEKLQLAISGGNHSHIKTVIKNLGLDTSHFLGKGYLKGKQHTWGNEMAPTEMFKEQSKAARKNVKARIIKYHLIPYFCSECGNKGTHNGKPLVLELDHINGKSNDNRLENLRFICPNCHSQEPTSGGKNNGANRGSRTPTPEGAGT